MGKSNRFWCDFCGEDIEDTRYETMYIGEEFITHFHDRCRIEALNAINKVMPYKFKPKGGL